MRQCGSHRDHPVRNTYRRWYAAAADRAVDTSDESFSATWLLVGDAESVTDQIEAYHDEVPFEQLIMLVHLAGMDPATSNEALRLFSAKVLPRFK
jgi:alkanesulfonate monooxygenase SsuD/methylene tetrahydromethanopterin reductase-like flavin-dependent oxidoreductase (luciferase family)